MNVPVQGQIVSFSEPLIPNKEAKFWFATERLTDAFRAAALRVEWVVTDLDTKKEIDRDTTRYEEDDRSETYDIEFETPGRYEVYAYVRHTYYRDNDQKKVFIVKSETAAHREGEQEEIADVQGPQIYSKRHKFDAGLDNDALAPSYTKGIKAEGYLPKNF